MKKSYYLLILPAFLLSFTRKTDVKPDIKKIKPNKQQYLIYTQKGDKVNLLSYLQRTIKDTIYNNKPALLCVQRYDQLKGTDFDSCFLNKTTMFPLEYRAIVGNQKEHFVFSNGKVVGKVTEKDSVINKVDEVFETGVYNSVAELELIESLPLKLNLEYKTRLINPGYPVSNTTLKVIAEENVIFNGNTIPCWVVLGLHNNSTTGAKYWIAKASGQLQKQFFQLKNGTQWWKVRTA